MAAPGPLELGRGVVVLPGMDPPTPWAAQPRVVIDQQVLDEPSAALAALQGAWSARQPVTVELAIDSKTLQERETRTLPVHDLSPRFEFARERLHFLCGRTTTTPATESRSGGTGARRSAPFADQGAQETDSADIELADGTALWVDGGPFAPSAEPTGSALCTAGTPRPDRSRRSATTRPRPIWPRTSWPRSATPRVAPGSSPPPGQGRPRVLTERLRYLLDDRGADPSTVTALAYNKKAADELKERCGGLVEGPRAPHPDTQQPRVLHL